MSSRPDGLLIVPIGPAPTGNGLAMRAANTLQGLIRVCNLTTLVVPLADPAADNSCLSWAAERSARCLLVRLPEPMVAARGWIAGPTARALITALQPLPQRSRLIDPVTVAEALGRTTFDLVWTMRLYLAPHAQPYLHPTTRTILDIDEDDAAMSRAIARLHRERGETELAARQEAEADAYDRLAGHCLSGFDQIVTASDIESAALRRRFLTAVVTTVPNAVELRPNLKPRDHDGQRIALLFLGNMDYVPNFDAARRLVESLFPALRRALPTAELHLVGRGEAITQLPVQPGVHIHGFIADLQPIYQQMDIAIVPLRVGGGSRLKILEAFANGLPVVATAAAAEGLALRSGEQLLLANSDDALISAILRLVTNADLAAQLVANGQRFIAEHHDAAAIAQQIGDELL